MFGKDERKFEKEFACGMFVGSAGKASVGAFRFPVARLFAFRARGSRWIAGGRCDRRWLCVVWMMWCVWVAVGIVAGVASGVLVGVVVAWVWFCGTLWGGGLLGLLERICIWFT